MSKVTFRIDLVYNQKDFEFMVGETFSSEADFLGAAKDYAVEDLLNYIRSEDLSVYAEIILSNEEDSE